jgi:hypothetical protein
MKWLVRVFRMVGMVVLLVLLIVRAAAAAGVQIAEHIPIVMIPTVSAAVPMVVLHFPVMEECVIHPPVIQLIQMHLFKPLQLTAQVFLPLLLL